MWLYFLRSNFIKIYKTWGFIFLSIINVYILLLQGIVKIIIVRVYLFLLFLGVVVWYILRVKAKEFTLVWLLIIAAVRVSLVLLLINLAFLSFCVYMGAAAGVVVLVAYCVALTSFTRRSDAIGLVEKVRDLGVLEVLKFILIILVAVVFIPVLFERSSLFRWKCFFLSINGIINVWNSKLYLEWGYLIVCLSVHLLLVIVCSVTMVRTSRGPLSHKNTDLGNWENS